MRFVRAGRVASCTLFEARSAYAVGMQLKIDVFGELNPEVASAHSHHKAARPVHTRTIVPGRSFHTQVAARTDH